MLKSIFSKAFLLLTVFSICQTNLLTANASPTTDSKAPDFTLTAEDGKSVSLSQFAGKVVVLEWLNPNCPFVKRHGEAGTMKRLAEKYAAKNVVYLGINSTHFMNASHNQDWIKKSSLPYHILMDDSGQVGKLYNAKTTPFMVVIDTNGKIAYQGAIDDDPYGDKDASKVVNYVDQALTALLAGKAIQLAETKSYGCSVKYAS